MQFPILAVIGLRMAPVAVSAGAKADPCALKVWRQAQESLGTL